MAKNLIGGNTTTINESGNDISVELNSTYTNFIDIDETLKTTAQTLPEAINELTPVILYNDEDSSISAKASLTLSDSAANYTYLEIFYGWDGGGFGLSSNKIYKANGKKANLGQSVFNNGYIYTASSTWSISGTAMTMTIGEYWRWGTSGTPSRTQTNQMAIYQVIGYK